MEKEIMDIIILVAQVLTLIALVVYVIKTWHIASATKESAIVSQKMLEEMKAGRDQEISPYVITYFDIAYGKRLIYLVIKNIGKTVAKNVKLEFEPKLKNSTGDKIDNTPLIKEGIGSIPPGYEIKTLFDSAISYFGNEKLPLSYVAKVTYTGGLQGEPRTTQQTLDLSAYKGLRFHDEKGIDELVKEIEKLVRYNEKISKELEKIAYNLADGIWLKNTEFMTSNLRSEPTAWKSTVLARLNEFKTLWSSVYGGDHDKLINPFFTDLKTRTNTIGAQILVISSNCPSNTNSKITDKLISVAVKLSELGQIRFYIDGRESIEKFDAKGNEIVNIIDEVVEQIESNHSATSDN